ncbi:MAG: HDIG domain-containing protein [Deltaproteobacteria bacterium]|nr:HDIG domain-containing protein [Deltaproteobacteria bacterium]
MKEWKIKREREMGSNPRQGAGRFKPEVQRWLILLALSLIISILLFPNILSRPKVYKLGDVAEADIKAPHDILVENEELTEKKREEAEKEVPYVYDFDPSASNLVFRLREAMSESRDYFVPSMTEEGQPVQEEMAPQEDAEERDLVKDRFFKILEILPDEAIFEALVLNGFAVEIENNIIRLVIQVFEKGVVGNRMVLMSQAQKGVVLQSIQTQEESLVTDLNRFYDIDGAKKHIKGRVVNLKKSTVPPQLVELSARIAIILIKPNVTFNKRETEIRKEISAKSVKPFYYKIKKGEMLVREGERIGPEHLLKLSALASSMGQTDMLGRVPGMVVLIGLLLSAVYMAGLMKFRSTNDEMRYVIFNAVTLLGLFIFFWAYSFIAEEIARGFHSFTHMALLFAMPVACGAMLITVFEGVGIAAIFSLIISVLVSLIIDGRVEFFIYAFVSCLIAAYGVRNYRERGILIKTGLKVGLVNIALCLSIQTIYGALYSVETVVALVAGFIGGVLAGVISTGIIPLVEMSFGFTTDIKLLELANLDQPLLKDLMVRTPGTYHHSVIVSNMVEATAEAIQANPLLAKVSAYYHDIGKMKKPLYFIENQMGGENRHEKLAPSMSSLVLTSHVKDGLELARKHKLGKEIIDIIQQHHGKSLISYFYQKAKEQAVNKRGKPVQVKEEDFRYPGPKPQTKEAGLVMLADMVEAASRSLVEPTPARIQGVVQKIVNRVFSDGQLDECELTLKDLHEIAKSFNKTLSGIFHHRVEYPETNIKRAKKTGNGDTDQFPAEDPGAKNPDDKEDGEEGLRRLGL